MTSAEPMEPLSKEQALAQVLDVRDRGRRRTPLARGALALAGLVLLAGSFPMCVLLPELGVPALLLSLRLLSTEFVWAARAYAWIYWRWGRFRAWFAGRSPPVRAAIVAGAVVAAAGIVWLVVSEA